MLTVVGLGLGCGPGNVVPMPQELVGFWQTSTEPYQDRYLVLTPVQVQFGTSETTSTTHEIAEVRSVGEAHERVYQISYLSAEGKAYWLTLRYEPEDRVLQLVNQPQLVWERAASFDG